METVLLNWYLSSPSASLTGIVPISHPHFILCMFILQTELKIGICTSSTTVYSVFQQAKLQPNTGIHPGTLWGNWLFHLSYDKITFPLKSVWINFPYKCWILYLCMQEALGKKELIEFSQSSTLGNCLPILAVVSSQSEIEALWPLLAFCISSYIGPLFFTLFPGLAVTS